MEQQRRIGTSRRRGRYDLPLGLVASALIHLLAVLLNPGTGTRSYGPAGGSSSAPAAQFTVLSLSPSDEDDLIPLEATPRITTPRTSTFGAPGAVPAEPGRGPGPESVRDATVAERLRAGARTFSAPVAPARESENQRAMREAQERVLRAGEELGPLPPNGVAPSRGGGGIRIPFGFGPPPPAVTVPAPPPPAWVVTRDSLRAAARAAAIRDSLRAARDTVKLRNVAPRRPAVLPRVVPDTTARES